MDVFPDCNQRSIKRFVPSRVSGSTKPAPADSISSAMFTCRDRRTGVPNESASATTRPKFSWCDGRIRAFAAADALILPSHHENFGLVVAEALSFGTPVLLSRQVNIAEDIESAGAGFVEPDTVEGTTRLIERWLQSGHTSMRQAALACYQNHFSIESSAGELLRVFTEDA